MGYIILIYKAQEGGVWAEVPAFPAPDTEFKNTGLDMTVLEQVKKLNCEVAAAYIDQGWIKDENCRSKYQKFTMKK